MKHPEPAEWMSFLYGELDPGRQGDLEAHLAVCPDCTERIERWQATMTDLDAAETPGPEGVTPVRFAWVPWAIAAGVVLAIGFGLGRIGRVSEREVRGRLERIESQMAQPASVDRIAEREAMGAAILHRTRVEQAEWLGAFLAEYHASQAEERREWLQMLEQIENRHALETARLKSGLASLASSTGSGFEQAQTQMRWFATRLAGGSEEGADGVRRERQPVALDRVISESKGR